MPDYLILSFEIPEARVRRLDDWLSAGVSLGWEHRKAEAGAGFRVYFDSGPAGRRSLDELKARFADLKILSETEIRLPGADDRPATLQELGLAGESFRLWAAPAFGSGSHPTTRLVAALLRRSEPAGKRVLDLGAGTGILALLASRLGAASVEAVEISAEARENARANFRLNACAEIPIFADLEETKGPYDLILANLLTPTLRQLRTSIQSRLGARGACLASGVTVGERGALLEAYSRGLFLAEELGEAEWLGFRFLKNPSESSS